MLESFHLLGRGSQRKVWEWWGCRSRLSGGDGYRPVPPAELGSRMRKEELAGEATRALGRGSRDGSHSLNVTQLSLYHCYSRCH